MGVISDASMPVPHLLQQLRSDNTSGATELLERAMTILETFVSQPLPTSASAFYGDLTALVRGLIAAQPSMAVMITLAQHVLATCPVDLAPLVAQQQLRQAVAAFRRQIHLSSETLCQHTLDVIPSDATILTYSNSGTVIAALRVAHQHGRVRRVFLSESRPAYDGRLQARRLSASGIAVDYSIDMGLFERLPETDVVLVGADAVFPHGVINKLGTHALVQLARLHHIPAYCLCTTTKWLPPDAATLFHIEAHPPHEVWSEAPETLCVTNHYFDTTPLDLLSGMISEAGICTPDELRQTLLQRRLAPVLRQNSA